VVSVKEFITRVSYLVTRVLLRPERAFSAVSSYHPVADITLITLLSLLWNALLAALPPARLLMAGILTPRQSLELFLVSVLGIVAAFLLIAVFALCVSITATCLGAHPRFLSTQLCFQLSGAVAFAISALPVTLIKLVDVGAELSTVSASLIAVAPWLYIAVLLTQAVLKVQRTVLSRAVAYLGMGVLPVVLVAVLLWRSFVVDIPLGFG
jgi:hypothetical protein